jgi:gallate dioxygenase
MSYVFDLERSARGLRLNRFLHRLTVPAFRDRFNTRPEEAMQDLSEPEKALIRRLDWKGMQDQGANFFCIEKLGRVTGVSNPEIIAHFRGETLDQFLETRRVRGAL